MRKRIAIASRNNRSRGAKRVGIDSVSCHLGSSTKTIMRGQNPYVPGVWETVYRTYEVVLVERGHRREKKTKKRKKSERNKDRGGNRDKNPLPTKLDFFSLTCLPPSSSTGIYVAL